MKFSQYIGALNRLFYEAGLSNDLWFEKEHLFREFWHDDISPEDAFVEIFDEYL